MKASPKQESLPRTDHYRYFDSGKPESPHVRFRLIYDGPLPSAGNHNNRTAYKHRIRKQLHQQLATLWKVHPHLEPFEKNVVILNDVDRRTVLDYEASRFQRCGYRFIPIVTADCSCSLDVLFLRRDRPGKITQGGGDIDGRIKVLLDALRMPQDCNELRNATPDADEDPFFCLLEDDSLVSELKVTTDRLLRPQREDEHINDVLLVIMVEVTIIDTKRTDRFQKALYGAMGVKLSD